MNPHLKINCNETYSLFKNIYPVLSIYKNVRSLNHKDILVFILGLFFIFLFFLLIYFSTLWETDRDTFGPYPRKSSSSKLFRNGSKLERIKTGSIWSQARTDPFEHLHLSCLNYLKLLFQAAVVYKNIKYLDWSISFIIAINLYLWFP